MIVLDTNVLSELMRPSPNEAVLGWIGTQSAHSLYVTTFSYAEILFGIALLQDGKRRARLAEQAEGIFAEDFAGRILCFDLAAGAAYPLLAAKRQKLGNRISAVDGMIAAIAKVRGCLIASRDRDFNDCGVQVVNPWDAG